jgi:hypothetical protein
MDLIGFYGGPVRAPLDNAGEDARHEIARLLVEAGAMGDNAACG